MIGRRDPGALSATAFLDSASISLVFHARFLVFSCPRPSLFGIRNGAYAIHRYRQRKRSRARTTPVGPDRVAYIYMPDNGICFDYKMRIPESRALNEQSSPIWLRIWVICKEHKTYLPFILWSFFKHLRLFFSEKCGGA
jgi:hypothetical protein